MKKKNVKIRQRQKKLGIRSRGNNLTGLKRVLDLIELGKGLQYFHRVSLLVFPGIEQGSLASAHRTVLLKESKDRLQICIHSFTS